MKHYTAFFILLYFATLCNAQNNDYNAQWEEVTRLENEGLTKSAAKAVDAIYQRAKAESNTVQTVKSVLYQSKYLQVLEDESQLRIVKNILSEIEQNQTVTKHLLENVLATMYWQYFQQNRYIFYNRTKTETKVTDDFRTWDLETLFHEIHMYYQKSLQNRELLQQTNLKDYDAVLITHKNSKSYRPTLFDLLAHNALQFYKTPETSITQPAYQFKIDTPEYVADSDSFRNLDITAKDSTNLQLHALKIYQHLLKLHRKNTASKAYVAIDIERLEFVKEHATLSTIDDDYSNTLNKSALAIKHTATSGLYLHKKAELLTKQGQTYEASADATASKDRRWKLKDALTLCNDVVTTYPESIAAEKCITLKHRILQPDLRLRTEQFLPVNTPSKILVHYKNLDTLNFNIYKVTQKQLETLNTTYKKDEKKAFIDRLSPYRSWSARLKNESDYQQHSTELILPKLVNGLYIIKVTTPTSDSVFALADIQVTNFVLTETNGNTHLTYQIINRNSGSPVVGANVTLRYKTHRSKKRVYKTFTTDAKGQFIFERQAKYFSNVTVTVSHNSETAHFGDWYIGRAYKDHSADKETYNSSVFTDRSIYRPGQPVYFKGIVTKTYKAHTEIAANETVFVTLHNVNNEDISTFEFTTNAYGSFHGEFILPNDGLTGQFYIKTHITGVLNNRTYISVEEYKRPKFETTLLPITKTYRVNDTITVDGKAIAFAGSAITNAKVVYRVKRKTQPPRWYYWDRPYFSSQAQEITYGESTTDDSGNFQIQFKALPDDSFSKDQLPVFNYEVTADVTDINGETRSATTVVNVAYHTVLAKLDMPARIHKAKGRTEYSITTTNLNGEFVPVKGTFKLYKRKVPEAVYRRRPWQAPDYQVIPETEFKTLFPYERYTRTNTALDIVKRELVYETHFETTANQEPFILKPSKRWRSGDYIAVIETTDPYGQLVKDEAQITLFNPEDKTVADKQLFTINLDKDKYASGNMAKLRLGSAVEDVHITLHIEKNDAIVSTNIYKLNNSIQVLDLPISADDVGGFVIHYSFSAYNSYTSGKVYVNVPYPETDLEITTQTFRNKLDPGQDETWQFTIKGPKGDKVAAEVLASMYDASLDMFKPHQWQFYPLQKSNYYANYNTNANKSFGTQDFRMYNRFNPVGGYPHQRFDRLNWFGFYFGNEYQLRRTYLRKDNSKPSTFTSSKKSDIKSGYIKGIIASEEDGFPLPGANILIKGSTTEAVTDFDGNFILSAKEGDKIQVSYLGMNSLEFKVSKDNYYIIRLTNDATALDELVVVGYGVVQEESTLRYKDAISAEEEAEDMEIMEPVDSNDSTNNQPKSTFSAIKIRKNLQETAFFFPQLQTDKNGIVRFNFKAPEALTQWKLQLLAHTKTLESATSHFETVTQKELMVIPNPPRFLRDGDTITISTKIANLSKKNLSGTATLSLTDAYTGNDVSTYLLTNTNKGADKTFSVDANGNTQVSWILNIPEGLQAIEYKIIAQSGNFSDGEQNVLPVLSNRMLVTETLPMWIGANETKTFTLNKLKHNTSTTLKHHKLTLEMTSNPAWYALQALPYLMEYPYECNEQTFSRYYANALAQHIVQSNPRIASVFHQWRSSDALVSNLEKNQELKALLIEETPWLRDAQSETEQKKRIALLFDLNKMNTELQSALSKLQRNQETSGAWAWFNGGDDNRYITQHIIAGLGHLKALGVTSNAPKTSKMIRKAITYLDAAFITEYDDLKKYDNDIDLTKDHLSYSQLHYLYTRSFYPDISIPKRVTTVMAYYKSQIEAYWLKRSLYAKGLMALAMHRMDDAQTAQRILKSLKENSITSEELGMYWKANTASYFWYQAPVETQALLIEAFSEIDNDTKTVDNLKIWLLKHKQTNQWHTTKATTEAVYALLLQGSAWLEITDAVDVTVGNETITPSTLDGITTEAGTGYYKTAWTGAEITSQHAEVRLTTQGKGMAWGALYWQYFDDLDKITPAKTPLQLNKQLFLKTNRDTGEVLSEITETTKLEVGDLVRVRIELQSDRAMEFLHLKDMRASGFEPVNVLSQYKWQEGLGYYESTKDAATNFFIDYLPKGIYIFEYDLRVNNEGDMSNGITTIQSMYAPEFSSHSEGVRVSVKNKK